MKHEKCSFFKKHIQYLGHLVSAKGFEPFPEKLDSIRNMPVPRTAKDVKQFFGFDRLLPEVHSMFRRHLKASDKVNMIPRTVRMDRTVQESV